MGSVQLAQDVGRRALPAGLHEAGVPAVRVVVEAVGIRRLAPAHPDQRRDHLAMPPSDVGDDLAHAPAPEPHLAHLDVVEALDGRLEPVVLLLGLLEQLLLGSHVCLLSSGGVVGTSLLKTPEPAVRERVPGAATTTEVSPRLPGIAATDRLWKWWPRRSCGVRRSRSSTTSAVPGRPISRSSSCTATRPSPMFAGAASAITTEANRSSWSPARSWSVIAATSTCARTTTTSVATNVCPFSSRRRSSR